MPPPQGHGLLHSNASARESITSACNVGTRKFSTRNVSTRKFSAYNVNARNVSAQGRLDITTIHGHYMGCGPLAERQRDKSVRHMAGLYFPL